ncbi:hypothetical protein IEQ34_006746 [Dendrobium chrysotoxum]|uniref:Uncharacterized protein n=1 Tax=Dendrobium chrysotoxum TaxID=161865 RepID=A0AAV7H7E8_DENCH|nr:hypothetical protein IEQ34_006746 [Dendrobium chrysotoxum]
MARNRSFAVGPSPPRPYRKYPPKGRKRFGKDGIFNHGRARSTAREVHARPRRRREAPRISRRKSDLLSHTLSTAQDVGGSARKLSMPEKAAPEGRARKVPRESGLWRMASMSRGKNSIVEKRRR